jgi:hypothetical protein
LNAKEDDILTIADFSRMIQGATGGKSIADEYVPGLYRLLCEVISRADSLQKLRDDARQIVHHLANP